MGEQVVGNPARAVDRYREAESDRAAARRIDRAVDADDFARRIEQRSARVAWVDRGVGLHHVDVHPATFAHADEIPSGAADHPGGHAWLAVAEEESVRIADGDRPFTDQQLIRVA